MKHIKMIGFIGFIIAGLILGLTPCLQATEVTPKLIPVPEKGVYRTYSIQYSDENTTTLFPDRIGQKLGRTSTFMSTLSFDGDLRVKDYGQVEGHSVYSLSFDAVRSRQFALNGHDVFDNTPSFIDTHKNNEIYVSMNSYNEIERFYFPDNMTQVFKTFMTTVAQEIQVSVQGGKASWSTQEVNQHGKGTVNYKITGTRGDKIELLKTRKNYEYPGLIEKDDRQSIHTNDKITVNPRGFVEDINKHEETTITSSTNKATILNIRKSLKLKLTGRGDFEPGQFGVQTLNTMQAVRPGEPIEDKEQNRELLAKRVSFTTYTEIENWIKGFKPNKKDNRANNSMFYRTTGFVELHPKSAEKLADFCKKNAKTSRERVLVMNILAAVGNTPAQKAMRTILSSETMKKNRLSYGIMVQNFSFVDQKPDPETVDFLKGLMTKEIGYLSYSAAHAYGAVIHKLYQGSKTEKKHALELNKALLSKISGAKQTDEKAEYIAALGNAGMIENNDLLFGFSKTGSPRVRMEAVMALRKTETPKCRNVVLTVFNDTERAVQRSAIQTFFHFSPEKANLKTIKSKLDKEIIEEANFYDMTTLLQKHRRKFPDLVNDCYKLMVRKKLHDPDLEARIRGLIQKR